MRIGIVTEGRGFAGGLERYSWMVALGLKERGHFVRHLHGPLGGRDTDEFASAFNETSPTSSKAKIADLDVIFVQRADTFDALAPFGNKPLLVASHDHRHTCIRVHRYLPLGSSPCHRAPGLGCITRGCAVNRVRNADGKSRLELRSPFSRQSELLKVAERAILVPCSRYVGRQLEAAGVPAERIRVVHPIPQEHPTPLVPRPEAHRLVVVAQLLRGKGVDFAIDALPLMSSDVTLTVVGEGPSRTTLEKQARAVAPGRVTFTGYVPPDQIEQYYDQARVVLVPSRWPEPFGMVGIEAMRRGRPVVAANHGGIPEWAPPDAGGRLFEPGSPAELARVTASLLKDDQAGDKAFEFTNEKHRHGRLLDELEALLDEQTTSAS